MGSHSVEYSIGPEIASVAEANDGTALVEWSDHSGNYETYAPPGKGWSHTSKLLGVDPGLGVDPDVGPERIEVAFNGRGERLAVWSDGVDVRRPGAQKPLLRASLTRPRTFSGGFVGAHAIGSSGCDFLVDQYDDSSNYQVFLVRCKPHWSVTRVVGPRNNTAYYPAFDGNGRPGLFEVITPAYVGMLPPWERLLYATIEPNGHLSSSKKIALLTKPGELIDPEMLADEPGLAVHVLKVVPGTSDPTLAWITRDGEIWKATPEGTARLSASRGPLPQYDGLDAISDDRGGAIVAWPAWKNGDPSTIWLSLSSAHGRRIEKVGLGSRPVLARAGKKLFVIDAGSQPAIFAKKESSWKAFDLGESCPTDVVTSASGPRATFAWTHSDTDDGDLLSADLYTWIYPRP